MYEWRNKYIYNIQGESEHVRSATGTESAKLK